MRILFQESFPTPQVSPNPYKSVPLFKHATEVLVFNITLTGEFEWIQSTLAVFTTTPPLFLCLTLKWSWSCSSSTKDGWDRLEYLHQILSKNQSATQDIIPV